MGTRRSGTVARAREPQVVRLFGVVALAAFAVAVIAWPVAFVLDSQAARIVSAAAIGAWPVLVLAFLVSGGFDVERASGDRVRAVAAVVGGGALVVVVTLGLAHAVVGDGRLATARALAGGVLAACFLVSVARRGWRPAAAARR